MTFEELQDWLADWYDIAPDALGLPDSEIPDWLNPVLKDFYRKFGGLAGPTSKFSHPKSPHYPLSGQDHIVPVEDLKSENGFTVFCIENQNVFVVAARDNADDDQTYAEGDNVLDRTTPMIGLGISLTECLVTCVLRETIISVGDRYRRIDPESANAALEIAKTGKTLISSYIWPDSPFTFHLSKEVWFMDWDGMEAYAHRGIWQNAPSTWQDVIFENGGHVSSGPAKPTLAQRLDRFVTNKRTND